MAIFVINEWLWADLSGANKSQQQRETFDFITKLAASDHKIVVVEGSSFDQKAWSLCKSTAPMIVQRLAAAYVRNVRQNSDRCLILRPQEMAVLPDELARKIKPDDHYLVRAQFQVQGAILVTTDAPLRQTVAEAGLSCLSRDEFMRNYF